MRVVFGVQFVAHKQVSRTKTWRKPLLRAPAVVLFAAAVEFAVWLGLTDRNAMNRPDELIECRMLSVPTRAPLESVETSCVDGAHDESTPKQVSRKSTWRPATALATRFVA